MLAAVLTYLRLESRWSQSALSNAQQKDERQSLQGQTKELLIGYKKKIFTREWLSTGTGTQRNSEISLLGDFQNAIGQGPQQPGRASMLALLLAGSWTKEVQESLPKYISL